MYASASVIINISATVKITIIVEIVTDFFTKTIPIFAISVLSVIITNIELNHINVVSAVGPALFDSMAYLA